jgi:hypothetical protein
MPLFQPNDYMYENFKKEVKVDELGAEPENWEIYAWCVRDAMSKHSGMQVSDVPLRKKLEYEDFMNCKRN